MKLFDSKSVCRIASVFGLVSIGLVCGMTGSALAATNQATGDIGGDPGDLTDSNVFTITSSVLALVKAAYSRGLEAPDMQEPIGSGAALRNVEGEAG